MPASRGHCLREQPNPDATERSRRDGSVFERQVICGNDLCVRPGNMDTERGKQTLPPSIRVAVCQPRVRELLQGEEGPDAQGVTWAPQDSQFLLASAHPCPSPCPHRRLPQGRDGVGALSPGPPSVSSPSFPSACLSPPHPPPLLLLYIFLFLLPFLLHPSSYYLWTLDCRTGPR